NPDIVVLEGGYSIEGALPYVNVGLILALAGLDYSHLKEPDWLPDSSRQPQHVMEIIRQTVDQVRKLWDQRQQVDLRQIFGTGEFFTRQRPIYYDTDQIVEKQHEQI